MLDQRTMGPIAVLGATGQQGGAVVRSLQRTGVPAIAIVRDPSTQRAVDLSRTGVEVVVADQADTEALVAAFAGAHGVFSVQPSSGQPGSGVTDADEVTLGVNVADAASEAGVAHLVYSSANAAASGSTGVGHFDSKHRIEQHVHGLDLCRTILRPAAFMELLVSPGSVTATHVSFLMRADQLMQFIAVDDIGDVATNVFAAGPAYDGRTIELAGDALTGDDVAREITATTGHQIRYERLGEEALGEGTFLGSLAALIDQGPLAGSASLDQLRTEFPFLQDFRTWLSRTGAALSPED